MNESNDEIVLGFREIQAIADERSRRVSAWDEFSKQVKARIMSNRIARQPLEQVAALLNALPASDLHFPNQLAITEVLDPNPRDERQGDRSSGYWDLTYGCLAASSGDFAPFSPPDGETYYRGREQALIAAVGWLAGKSDEAYELLLRNDEAVEEIKGYLPPPNGFVCPQCGFSPDADEEDEFNWEPNYSNRR
jgi:hypothetical protein